MEDKSPLHQDGVEFRALTEDTDDDSVETQKSKRKKRFSELMARLMGKEGGDPKSTEEEQATEPKHRFVDALRGKLFGLFTGIEKEEVDEPDHDEEQFDHTEDSTTSREFHFPLLNRLEQSEDRDGNNPDSILSPDKPRTTTTPEDTPMPQSESLPTDGSSAEQAEPIESAMVEAPSEPQGIDAPADMLPDRDDTIASHGFAQEKSPSVEHVKETVIEQKGGGGAALLAFVAAETLSRSRDAKIRKEATELKKQVEKQQERMPEVQHMQEHNREQIEQLKNKRAQTERVMEVPYEMRTSHEKKEVSQSNTEPEKQKSQVELQRVSGPEKQNSKLETEPKYRAPEVILDRAEKAAESDVALEGYYERRHEAKDVPTASSQQGTGAGSGGGNVHTTSADPHAHIAQQLYNEQQAINNQREGLYRRAAKQGVQTGIILLVAFIVLVLLWSLLHAL